MAGYCISLLLCLLGALLFASLLPPSLCLSLAKLMDKPTSVIHSTWLNGPDIHSTRQVAWLNLKLVPLASAVPSNFSSTSGPTGFNRYNTVHPRHRLSDWFSDESGQPKSATKSGGNVDYPSGSNRDAPLISTKSAVTKRNPPASSTSDGNRYIAAEFDPFNGDLDNFFNTGTLDSEPAIIDTADRSQGSPSSFKKTNDMDNNDLAEMFKFDQMDKIFNMDLF